MSPSLFTTSNEIFVSQDQCGQGGALTKQALAAFFFFCEV